MTIRSNDTGGYHFNSSASGRYAFVPRELAWTASIVTIYTTTFSTNAFGRSALSTSAFSWSACITTTRWVTSGWGAF